MDIVTIEEIRRSNLLLLIQENGGPNGGQTQVALRSKTSPTYLSQIVIRFTKPSGQVAIVGSKLARKLEEGCNKPVGWMDILHESSDPERDELGALYSMLSNNARIELLEFAREMSKRRKKK